MRSEMESDGAKRSLHQQYEPEAPIHRAVNITYRMLQDRIEPFQHDEHDLWKARDPETGRESEHWWRSREEAVEFLAKDVDLDICYVNECTTHLGKDSDRLVCDECHPDEYVECAEEECDYPTSHTKTEYCSHHTWHNGRSVESET